MSSKRKAPARAAKAPAPRSRNTRAAADTAPAPKPVAATEAAATDEPSPVPAPAQEPPAAAGGPAGLKLEASCTLRDTIDMQFQLLAVDFGDSDVRVDGSAVERIDTAGLQLLLSFVRHQAGRGKAVKWTAASPELLRSSQVLGLDGLLGMSDVSTGSSARGH